MGRSIEILKTLSETKNKNEAVDAGEIIKELIDTGWSGDNESQMKAVQLLKGLATSDDPKSNAFMKKLDNFTSGMKANETNEALSSSAKKMLKDISDKLLDFNKKENSDEIEDVRNRISQVIK